MKNVFDDVADRFAGGIDRAMRRGSYVRGDLFLEHLGRTVAPGSYVLDYGCGPGRIAIMLARAGYKVRGVDTSEGMIKQALALERTGLQVDFATIAKPDEVMVESSFDAIVCSSVIEYVPTPDELLQGFRRALRPSGTLVISYANSDSYWRKRWQREGEANPMTTDHHLVWNWPEFRTLLERNGFETTARPKFFESPWDGRPWGDWFRNSPLIGSVGVVAARPVAAPKSA